MNIHLSKKQVEANIQHRGGFPGISCQSTTHLTCCLATGLLSGAVGKAVGGCGLHPSRHRGGDQLYMHKSGLGIEVEPTKGNGLQWTPNRLVDVHRGDGLYLK